jgi:hypothetical protein
MKLMDDNIKLIITLVKQWIRAHKLPIIIVFVIMLAAGAVVSQKVLEITENPTFCGKNCHIMRPYYDAWSVSPHKDVACIECHYEPGLIGHLKGKINGLLQFYEWETNPEGSFSSPTAKVSDENCLTCHANLIYNSNNNFIFVNFSHSDHPIQLNCIICHTDVKHSPTISALCDSCHAAQHPRNWLSEHKNQSTFNGTACTTCHLPQYCIDCHVTVNANTTKGI